MSAREYVCARCGKSDRFHEPVIVRAYRDVILEVRDGRPSFKRDSHIEVDTHEAEADGLVECECGAQITRSGEGLRLVFDDWRPGDAAVLPDGLRARVETFDSERLRLTVEGWHEEFGAGEVSPVLPISRSLAVSVGEVAA